MAPMYFGAGPTRVTVLVCVTGIGYLLIPVRFLSHLNHPIVQVPSYHACPFTPLTNLLSSLSVYLATDYLHRDLTLLPTRPARARLAQWISLAAMQYCRYRPLI